MLFWNLLFLAIHVRKGHSPRRATRLPLAHVSACVVLPGGELPSLTYRSPCATASDYVCAPCCTNDSNIRQFVCIPSCTKKHFSRINP